MHIQPDMFIHLHHQQNAELQRAAAYRRTRRQIANQLLAVTPAART